jgi:hypothetical protein
MTFADLLTTLEAHGALTPSRVKDVRTSLRYLAQALGHGSIDVALVDDACRDPARWTKALETHFATLEAAGQVVSPITRRNTRNNLRAVFRAAEAQGLLAAPLPSRLLKPQLPYDQWRDEHGATTPYPITYRGIQKQRYALRQDQWPPDIVAGWTAYRRACGMRVRETTFGKYARELTTYFGYIAHVVGRTPVWEDLFDKDQVIDFVQWHAKRLGSNLTAHGRHTARDISTIANVIKHPNHAKLLEFSSGLPPAKGVHVKQNHMLPLDLLDEVAHTLMAEGRLPLVKARRNGLRMGLQRASRFQCGLILALLVRVPLRQRNIREMKLGPGRSNLYQDQATGKWQLHFEGDELKVGHRRRGAVNVYHVPLSEYCPEWVALLEEFLTTYRPCLQNGGSEPYVFLTRSGKPYSVEKLYESLAIPVARRTCRRFYPHLIRTMWATAYLNHPDTHGDFQGAATMLGDTLAMTIQAYSEPLEVEQQMKAKGFLAKVLQRR